MSCPVGCGEYETDRTSLANHPKLNFTVVVNPHSGPGDKPAPNEQYTAAITQLSTYPNAQLLGYVRTGYATRNLSDVLDEISVYAGWSAQSSSLTMHGIFLDEAPHEFSEAAVQFMRTVGQEIKGIEGLGEPKTVIISFLSFSDKSIPIHTPPSHLFLPFPPHPCPVPPRQDRQDCRTPPPSSTLPHWASTPDRAAGKDSHFLSGERSKKDMHQDGAVHLRHN